MVPHERGSVAQIPVGVGFGRAVYADAKRQVRTEEKACAASTSVLLSMSMTPLFDTIRVEFLEKFMVCLALEIVIKPKRGRKGG